MSHPFLRLEDVSKWYGQVIALNDVTVEVPAGITGLLGPNGAGKSTFLKLATGLIRPRKGTVRLMGMDPWNNPPLMARVGLSPEHDAFYEWMTGQEFVQSLLRLGGYSRTKAASAAHEAIARVDLLDSRHRRISEYSKGMRQRIKIAQALAHEPEALFLDEPMTGTDPIARRDLVQLIRRLGKEGLDILVSSHVLHEIESMTRNILLIAKGQIVAEGDLHQIRNLIDEHPHNVHIEVSDPRRLASALVVYPDVVNVRLSEGAVLAETQDPDAFYARMPRVMRAANLKLKAMSSPDDNLQAVFKYLVR